MKKIIFFFFLIVFSRCTESDSPDNDLKVPDNGVKIGEQIWMKENLKVKTFRNGDPINESKTTDDWIKFYNEKKPTWTTYLWEENSEKIYGVIYNYYAMIDSRGLAPESWRIPTSTDFFNLVEFNGGGNSAPIKIMSKDFWIENPGNNESGFNATPGSEIWSGGAFGFRNEYVTFWTTSTGTQGNPILLFIDCTPNREITFSQENSTNSILSNRGGFYIRCIKE